MLRVLLEKYCLLKDGERDIIDIECLNSPDLADLCKMLWFGIIWE
jgi:hypothetical protein